MTEWLSSLAAEYADQIEMSLRLCAATIAGMVVGINRDIHNKPIGMRTWASSRSAPPSSSWRAPSTRASISDRMRRAASFRAS